MSRPNAARVMGRFRMHRVGLGGLPETKFAREAQYPTGALDQPQ